MKKKKTKRRELSDPDMLAEYTAEHMKNAVRGKHVKPYRSTYSVRIHKEDGSTVIEQLDLHEGSIALEPEVRRYFPDSKAVNTALRCLIPLVAQKKKFKSAA